MNFNNVYKGKKVLVTGHTGFKGSWLTYWLQQLGTDVVGYSLAPNTTPNHFSLLKLDVESHFQNICDFNQIQKVIHQSNPDIIFHLAAQPLVRYSYSNPIETYQTNVMGTVNVLECARRSSTVKAVVVITSDKCYENIEQQKGYVETDKMGGYDPYSSSKGCTELVTNAYRTSYFNMDQFNKSHHTLLASARAGNVIGGGDWSEDRLIPDVIRGASSNATTSIRNPHATRPWQHVLEPLSGYLLLGQKLLEGKSEFAEGWNFGPEENQAITVQEVLAITKKRWENINYKIESDTNHPHEAGLLQLNINKVKQKLNWHSTWNNETSIQKTIEWYKMFYLNGTLNTEKDLKDFLETKV